MCDVASSRTEIGAALLHTTSDGIVPSNAPTRLINTLEEIYESEETILGFRDGLVNAGFVAAGADVFVDLVRGVTVEMMSNQVFICVDNRSEQDVDAFVAKTLANEGSLGSLNEFVRRFGGHLIAWVETPKEDDSLDARRVQAGHEVEVDGFSDDDDADDHDGCVNTSLTLDLSLLPSAAELGASVTRRLVVITFGCHVVRTRPVADWHYCIDDRRIRYRLSGRNAAKCCGLDEFIQARVCRCAFFSSFVGEIVRDVEAKSFAVVAIFCRKGRHRSVAAAEILKRAYYPEAVVRHQSL
jgi:hypothetical protein